MEERWKPSVTVAAVIERDGSFLLVEEHTSEGLKLNNPAGHLDPGESPQQGVVREALEETGCIFTPTHLLGVYLSRFHRPSTHEDVTYVRFAFAGTVSDPAPGWVLDQGIVRTLWMTPEEIRASVDRHRSPLVLRCIEDYLAGRSYPLDVVSTDPTVFAPEIKTA
ncbi:NUDIX hydrolase [Aquabacterium sp. A7-Y]|uniref:NUDIX hydrolase n=1 Tax=Aquabacterium sp. A7-Y TaxID=1349605 RepID=UPI00223D799F|nr:NUDIX hydrolase [Aquabacterium sp. A7-Y]MCW7538887.1 NUDIX hydrolase [Aquabacterium sp. A7-Y]